jgi:flagellar hook assembly protein FlgD
VTITIYDLFGSVVMQGHMEAIADQTNAFVWNGRNGKDNVVANGGYIARITGSGFDYRRKIAVVK